MDFVFVKCFEDGCENDVKIGEMYCKACMFARQGKMLKETRDGDKAKDPSPEK